MKFIGLLLSRNVESCRRLASRRRWNLGPYKRGVVDSSSWSSDPGVRLLFACWRPFNSQPSEKRRRFSADCLHRAIEYAHQSKIPTLPSVLV